MVDRDQTRRDAERYIEAEAANVSGDYSEAARIMAALLSELEQAERQRDLYLRQYDELLAKYAAADARLAKVPALVGALRKIIEVSLTDQVQADIARDALDVWEQE
jgi:hypothetical protein